MRSIDELASEICTLAGHINAANHRWLLLVAEYDRRDGWSDGATQSCAHWLNWRCGIAMGAAREKVRVARALETLPKISAAMASGALSYSKVREITRVASAETEDYLLMIAEHGTAAQVEKLVRTFRRCQEAEELSREARQQQSRRVSYRYDDDGSLILDCRLPAEAGAKIVKALEIALEQLPEDPPRDVPAGTLPEQGSFQRATRGRPRPRRGELSRAGRPRSDRRGSPPDRGARREGNPARPRRGMLRVRTRALDGSGNRAAARLRRKRGRIDRRRRRGAAECRPQDADYFCPSAPRPERPRQGLPISRLLQHPLHRCASRRALGQRRRDETFQSRVAMPLPSPRRS